jgi:prepilin-type N-terminal cleavage/methylation domain-containing protein
MPKKTIRNQKGFTLIEIIAVLVILGILAAVAVTRYLNTADEARMKAARGAIAEIQGRLSQAQAKYMLANNGVAPTGPQLYTYATGANGYGSAVNLRNVGNDFTVNVTSGTPININVTRVQGVNLTNAANGNFRAAGDP